MGEDSTISLAGFLRGINVGGRHKVPMAELRDRLNAMGFSNVKTILNSGNFVCDTTQTHIKELENKIEELISRYFGFPIPVILKTRKEISELVADNPFKNINTNKDTRLYVSFLKDAPARNLPLPYISGDNSFRIISCENQIILSVLDLSATKTTQGMEELEKLYGKGITTRNWNTIQRICNL